MYCMYTQHNVCICSNITVHYYCILGKTYTMMGPRDNPGVNIRSIKELFTVMKSKDKTEFTMKVTNY